MSTHAVITPENFLDFCGGRVTVAQAAQSFRPGSEEWGKKIFEFINERATIGVTQFFNDLLSGHFGMFEMMHGPRVNAKDADDWDATLAEQTVDILTPHMALFCKADNVPDWLMKNAGEVDKLANDANFRSYVCSVMAMELTNSLLTSRPTANKVLSRLGISADAKGWPEPVPGPGEEPVVKKRRGRPPRIEQPAATPEGARRDAEPLPSLLPKPKGGRKKAQKVQHIIIAGSWIEGVLKNGVSLDEFAAVSCATKATVRRAMEPGKDGLAVTYSVATELANFVHQRVLALTSAHANISMLVMMSMPQGGEIVQEAA